MKDDTLIISVTSVKGGTGKTTNTLNLAGAFYKMNKKVLIIDLDLSTGDIAAILDLENEKDIYNLFEDITNNNFNDISEYITKYNEFIDVICAPKDPRFASKVNSTLVSFIISKVKYLYDIILIDTNHFVNAINLTAFDKSSIILYIINNDLMNLKSMKSMISIFDNMNKTNFKILLNESRNKEKGYFSMQDIESVIKHKIDYYISSNYHIKNINNYIVKGNILTLNNLNAYNKIYNNIATKLLEKVKYEK